MSSGVAKAHRANPAASIRVNQLHGIPVLMSGLSSLVLRKPEIEVISKHHKKTLINLQKLHANTPDTVVFFLSGTLPGSAILHLKQFSLFGMITRLPGSVLHELAIRMMTCAKPSSTSWFQQIRNLFLQYLLPHPLTFLENPLSKCQFKRLVKSKVQDYWQENLRSRAKPNALSSLSFFKPQFMSLSKPHPLWTTASFNPYETNKAIVQARMLSGRYRTEGLCRFWSTNPAGTCLLPECSHLLGKEDITHILITCKSLTGVRNRLIKFFTSYSNKNPYLSSIISEFLFSANTTFQTQFLLDCSTLPEVITLRQTYGFQILESLFYISRTWCYSLHRERLRKLDRWSQL